MVRTKYFNIDPAWLRKPWWFGYNQKLLVQLNRFAEAQFSRSFFARLHGVAGSLGLLRRKTWV